MKRGILIGVLCVFVATPALADMTITLADGVGTTAGGEFIATVTGDPILNYAPGAKFSTFCLETSENVSFGKTYYVTLNDRAIQGGTGSDTGDPLDDQTKIIYNYWMDTLTHDATNADDVQRAIWYQEGETVGGGNYLNSIAGNATGVWVMNLWTTRDPTSGLYSGYAQDLLVRVPVPGAVLLGLLGLGAAGLRLRKFA